MGDESFRVQVEIEPRRMRAAVAQALRTQAAGAGVDVAGAPVFFREASLVVMELLGDLDFGADTPDDTLNELANRVAHLLVGATFVGFRALVMLEKASGSLDYPAALAAIEAEVREFYPDPPS